MSLLPLLVFLHDLLSLFFFLRYSFVLVFPSCSVVVIPFCVFLSLSSGCHRSPFIVFVYSLFVLFRLSGVVLRLVSFFVLFVSLWLLLSAVAVFFSRFTLFSSACFLLCSCFVFLLISFVCFLSSVSCLLPMLFFVPHPFLVTIPCLCLSACFFFTLHDSVLFFFLRFVVVVINYVALLSRVFFVVSLLFLRCCVPELFMCACS